MPKSTAESAQAPAPRRRSPEERFWSYVDKGDDCWLWIGASHGKDGYGSFNPNQSPVLAHRYSYELAHGHIPAGMSIDHICRNRACVNPDHLQVVTQDLNTQNRSNHNPRSQSGIRGVRRYAPGSNKWVVQVGHNYRRYHGGVFTDLAEAERAAIALRNSLHTNNLADRKATA